MSEPRTGRSDSIHLAPIYLSNSEMARFLVDKLIRLARAAARRIHEKRPGGSYNAVTVAFTAHCCDAARSTHNKPLLVCGLPRLPLRGCSMPETCRCQFREWPDRRIGERRFWDRMGAERRSK